MSDDDQAAFLRHAQELLRIESVEHRPEEQRRALQYVLDYVGPGFTVEHFERNGKHSALVYKGKQRPERFRIVLNGHVDVLAGRPDQFKPKIDGDKLYARGALDMKVATLMQATVFRQLAPTLPYPIALQIVTDEELGGIDGTKLQVEHGVRGDFVVCSERSEMNISIDAKGQLSAIFTAHGEPGHTAYQWLYRNPANSLLTTLNRLQRTHPLLRQEKWRTTCTISSIQTDTAINNQTASIAKAIVSIRFVHDDPNFAHLNPEKIHAYLQSFCVGGVEVTLGSISAPVHAEASHPDVQLLAQAIGHTGHTPKFIQRHGANDLRHYIPVGCTGISFGMDGAEMHGPNEHINLRSIPVHYGGLHQFLRLIEK